MDKKKICGLTAAIVVFAVILSISLFIGDDDGENLIVSVENTTDKSVLVYVNVDGEPLGSLELDPGERRVIDGSYREGVDYKIRVFNPHDGNQDMTFIVKNKNVIFRIKLSSIDVEEY